MLLALLTLICCVTFSFEIVFGLAGTVLMMPVATLLYDPKTLVVFSLLPQLTTSSVALATSHRQVDWKSVLQMVLFASVGALIGVWVFQIISSELLKKILGLSIAGAGVFMLISPRLKLSLTFQKLLDVSAGFFHAMIGISGPIVATRLVGSVEDKTSIRNQLLTFFLLINILRLVAYVVTDRISPEILKLWLVGGPFIILAVIFSNRFHYRVPNVAFKKVITFAIILSGIVLLI